MTPNKNKKPLPSSTSMPFPEPPETFLQWRAALKQVNDLYARAQWKHCAAQCSQLLLKAKVQPHPLHAAYLHFYSAVSNEAIARLAHSLSPAKIDLLEQAKVSYQAAASSLPLADVGHEHHGQSDADTHSTCSTLSDEASDSWNGRPPRSSGSSQHEQPEPNTSSHSSMEDMGFSQASTKLRPSPLRIRKISSFRHELTDSEEDDQSPPSPCIRSQSPPQLHPQPQQQHHQHSDSTSSITSSTITSWLHARSQERYTASLLAFAEALRTHIATVDALMHKTRAVQSARFFTKRLASYGVEDDEETRAANLRFRIARLKAAGWKMERFAPGRYQELCARALAEL